MSRVSAKLMAFSVSLIFRCGRPETPSSMGDLDDFFREVDLDLEEELAEAREAFRAAALCFSRLFTMVEEQNELVI